MYGGCTWWGSLCVGPVFLIIQFLISFLSAPVVIASTYKRDYFNGLQGVLQSEQFKAKLLKEHQDEKAAEIIFREILDMSTRLFVFTEKPADSQETDQQVFERMFNLACLRHAAEMEKEAKSFSDADSASKDETEEKPTSSTFVGENTDESKED